MEGRTDSFLPAAISLWHDKRFQKLAALALWSVFLLVLNATGQGMLKAVAWAVPSGSLPLITRGYVSDQVDGVREEAKHARESTQALGTTVALEHSEAKDFRKVEAEEMIEDHAARLFPRDRENAAAKGERAFRTALAQGATAADAVRSAFSEMRTR